MPGKAMNAMRPVIPRSGSRKVNGYVKAVLALEAVRRKREDRYARVVRPLDRRRDELAAEVAGRPPPPDARNSPRRSRGGARYGLIPSNFAAVSPSMARRSALVKPGAFRM